MNKKKFLFAVLTAVILMVGVLPLIFASAAETLQDANVTLSGTSFVYNAAVQQPTVTVKNAAGKALTASTDYTVSFSSGCKYPGTYTVTIKGRGSYSGTVSKQYTITKQPISASRVTLSASSFVYNGTVQKPTVTVKNAGGGRLTLDSSYTVAYSAESKYPGTYTVTVTAKGSCYSGTVEKTYKITKQPLDASRVTLAWTEKNYNGAIQQPAVTVKSAAGGKLTLNSSYTVEYSAESKAPGEYTVTVTGKGSYSGSVTVPYTINRQPVDASRVTLSFTSAVYNSKVQKPTVTIKNVNGGTMKPDIQYTVEYSADSKAPGNYTVTVTGVGYYIGTATVPYTITKQPLDASRVTLSWTSAAYNGKVQQPAVVSVKSAAGGKLTLNSSYTVSYSADSKAPGSYTVSVTGKGYYTDTVTVPYTITKQQIDASRVTLEWTSAVYSGKVQQPAVVSVKNVNGGTMKPDIQYTVEYSADSKAPGDYTATVTGVGYFTGTAEIPYTIVLQPLDASRVTLAWTEKNYNGAIQQPAVTVISASGNSLKENSSYTVSYSADSKAPGNYTVTVTGSGSFTGSVTKNYTINRQPVVASRVTLEWTSAVYSGKVQQPAVVSVKNVNGGTMKPDIQYTVEYSADSKAPGDYTATVTGVGYFTGTAEIPYTIELQPLDASRVTLSADEFIFNGSVQQPTVTVRNAAGGKLTLNSSYTLAYSAQSVDPGTYTVTATGKGYYTGSVTKEYTILSLVDLTDENVVFTGTCFQYDGTAKSPEIAVTVNGAALVKDTDYAVSYSGGCIEEGQYTVTVTGLNRYVGEVSADFWISETGHVMTRTEAVEATCEHPGNNGYYTCERCGHVYADEEGLYETTVEEETIPQLEHDYSGEIKSNGDGTHSFLCVNGCGGYSEPINCSKFAYRHSYANCLTDEFTEKICEECGQIIETTPGEGKATGHAAAREVDATCTEAAYSIIECDHVYTVVTTFSDGEESVESKVCGYLEKVYSTDPEKQALGHDVNDNNWTLDPDHPATCVTGGIETQICARCHETLTRETIPNGHNIIGVAPVITEGDCDHTGLMTYTCKTCHEIAASYVLPAEHLFDDFGDFVTSVERTCTANGYLIIECDNHCMIPTAELAAGDLVRMNAESVTASDGTVVALPADADSTVVYGEIVSISDEGIFTLDFAPAGFPGKTGEFTTDDFTSPVTKVTIEEATGHSCDYTQVRPKTCTQDGIYKYKQDEITGVCECSECGAQLDPNTQITIKATGHTPEKGVYPTCTQGVQCTKCHLEAIAALGHDYKVPSCAISDNVNGFYCSRCGQQPAASADKLTTLVNILDAIKNQDYATNKVNYFSKTKMNTSYSKFDFGIYTSMVKPLYEQTVASEAIDYDFEPEASIWAMFPVYQKFYAVKKDGNNNPLVSMEDLDGIKIETQSGLDVGALLGGFSEKIDENTQTPDLSRFTGKTINEPVIKVTVDVKDERYAPTGSNIPTGTREENGNLIFTEETPASKIYPYDIRKIVNEAGYDPQNWTVSEQDDEVNMSMSMTLNYATDSMKLVYYFTADDYEPICMICTINEEMDQDLTMEMLSINGEIKPLIRTTRTYAYLFSNYFNTAA